MNNDIMTLFEKRGKALLLTSSESKPCPYKWKEKASWARSLYRVFKEHWRWRLFGNTIMVQFLTCLLQWNIIKALIDSLIWSTFYYGKGGKRYILRDNKLACEVKVVWNTVMVQFFTSLLQWNVLWKLWLTHWFDSSV